MENYSGSYTQKKKEFNRIFNIAIILFFLTLVTIITVGILIVNNPEVIGEFFGKIVDGFNG